MSGGMGKYWLPDPFPGSRELLLALKREAQQFHQEMMEAKKLCERERDIEWARVFRGFAADAMRQYRAICLVVPWYLGDPLPGDCTFVPPSLWPVELESEIRRVLGHLWLEK